MAIMAIMTAMTAPATMTASAATAYEGLFSKGDRSDVFTNEKEGFELKPSEKIVREPSKPLPQ